MLLIEIGLVILLSLSVKASGDEFCVAPLMAHLIVRVEGFRLRPGMKIPSGTEVSISCAPGYVLTGEGKNRDIEFKTYCLRSGSFLADFGRCIPVCEDVPKIDNGRISRAELDGEYLQQIRQIVCDSGYRLAGTDGDTISCGEETDGKWTNPGKCLRVCGRLPTIPNGAIMTINGTQRFVGATRRVVCNNGFILSGSSTVICNEDGTWHFNAQCWLAGSRADVENGTI